jgi:hypothetical protein
MATRISVSVDGLVGLDDQERLYDELTAETGLSWHRADPPDRGRVLSGVMEILLVAVVSKSGEMALEAAVGAVQRVVQRYRARSMDPPDVRIETRPEPDGTEPGGTAADDDGTGD